MKKAFGLAMAALISAAMVGCGGKAASDMPMNAGVTDVSATPVASSNIPPAAPVAQPVYDTMPTASAQTSGAATSGGSYTVKRGDTLYGIARAKYGDGKQWQKIASANPGLSPSSLKVGQTITLP